MRNDETPDWLITVVYVVGLALVCWLLLRSSIGSSPAPAAPGPSDPAAVVRERTCGDVVLRCVASAEVESEVESGASCNAKRLRQQLGTALQNPIEKGGCQGIIERLGQQCPDTCSLLGGSQLVVPSAVQAQLAELPNEAGICFAKGSINVSVRGTCVSK